MDALGPGSEPDAAWRRAVWEEHRRVRLLARVVDGAQEAIAAGRCPDRKSAAGMVERVRRLCLALFPQGGNTFDLIYRPRLARSIRHRFPPA